MPKDDQYFPILRNSEDCDWAKDIEQKGKGEILHCRLGKSPICRAKCLWVTPPQLILVSVALRHQGYFFSTWMGC